MQTKICSKCDNLFSLRAGNYNRHIKVCDGNYIKPENRKLKCCKYCSLDFTNLNNSALANHSRWCKNNPERDTYVCVGSSKAIEAMNKKRKETGFTNQYSKARIENRPMPISPSCGKPGIKGRRPSAETRELMSKKALRSKHRRLTRKLIVYKGITLDSSWELMLAKRLDALGINWIRPEPIDRKSTCLNSSHTDISRMPSSA